MTKKEHLDELKEMINNGVDHAELMKQFKDLYNEHLKPKSFPCVTPINDIYKLDTPPTA